MEDAIEDDGDVVMIVNRIYNISIEAIDDNIYYKLSTD